MINIALVGQARSGKSTAARALVSDHGYVEYAFADELREFLAEINPIVQDGLRWNDLPYEQLRKVAGAEVRQLQLNLGDLLARKSGPQVLTRAMCRRLERRDRSVPVVISDVRAPKELEFVKCLGFKVIYVYDPEPPAGQERVHHWTEKLACAFDRGAADAVFEYRGQLLAPEAISQIVEGLRSSC